MPRSSVRSACTNGSNRLGRIAFGIDEPVLCTRTTASLRDGVQAHRDRRAAARRRELRGVVQEVVDDLADPRPIAEHDDVRRRSEQLDGDLAGLEGGRVVLDRRVDELVQLEPLLVQADLPARDARDVEQVVDQARQLPDLTIDHGERPPRLLSAGIGVPEHVGAVADRAERIAKLVREHREELRLTAIGLEQRLLCVLALGDVAGDALDGDDGSARVADRREVLLHPDVAVTAMRDADLEHELSRQARGQPRFGIQARRREACIGIELFGGEADQALHRGTDVFELQLRADAQSKDHVT